MCAMPKTGMRLRQNTNTKVLEAIAQCVSNDIVASIGRQEGNLRTHNSAAPMMHGPDKEALRIIRAHRLPQTALL
jgi:hypothetical protein